MNRHVALAATVVLAICGPLLAQQVTPLPTVPSPALPPAVAVGKTQLDELVQKAEEVAEAWSVGDANIPVGHIMEGIALNAESAEVAKAVFQNKTYKPLQGLFMVTKMMMALSRSDSEVIQPLLPVAMGAFIKFDKFIEFTKRTKEEAAALNTPPEYDPKKPEDSLKRLNQWEEARRARVESDGRTGKNNRMVCELERHFGRVLLMANRSTEDNKLVEMLMKQETDKQFGFFVTLGTIALEAPTMDPPHATRLYRQLEKVCKPMLYARGDYIDLGVPPPVMTNGKPTPGFPGVQIMIVNNMLAARAKLPIGEVPEGHDIDAGPLLVKAKELIAKGTVKDQMEGLKNLAAIVTTYPKTKLLAEAKDLQAKARLAVAKALVNSSKKEEQTQCSNLLQAILKDSPNTPYEAEARKLIDQLLNKK